MIQVEEMNAFMPLMMPCRVEVLVTKPPMLVQLEDMKMIMPQMIAQKKKRVGTIKLLEVRLMQFALKSIKIGII